MAEDTRAARLTDLIERMRHARARFREAPGGSEVVWANTVDQWADELEEAFRAALVGEVEAPAPRPLNATQEEAAKTWAADDRLWTTQDTVAFNLRTFARAILSAQIHGGEAPAPRPIPNDIQFAGRTHETTRGTSPRPGGEAVGCKTASGNSAAPRPIAPRLAAHQAQMRQDFPRQDCAQCVELKAQIAALQADRDQAAETWQTAWMELLQRAEAAEDRARVLADELDTLCQAVEGHRAGALTNDGLWHYVVKARALLPAASPAPPAQEPTA